MSQFKLLEEIVKKLTEKKLYWSKLSGGSRKHFNDAVNVFEIQYGSLDMDYIGFWAQKLNIESLFEGLKIEADTLE